MTKHSLYPTYDVMEHRSAWDEHTQSIVTARLIREHGYRFITLKEAELLRSVCSLLTDDQRGEIIQYVLCHIDDKLHQTLGEGQRKPSVPKAQTLVRDGLHALDQTAQHHYGSHFFQLEELQQRELIMELSEAHLQPAELWMQLPQKPFFQKLLSFTVESYYSHPEIWSEIGYGGPAYPRGYIRTAVGQLDPWEAKKTNVES